MKKYPKIAAIALAVLLLVSAVIIPAYAVEFENGFNYVLVNSGSSAKITTAKASCVGSDGVLTLPDTLGGKPVTEIASGSLGFVKDRIKSIIFPATLETIEDNVFSGIKFEGELVLPAALRNLGAYAFQKCTKITSLRVNDALEVISRNAFSGCTALATIVFGSSVKTIDDYAFSGCPALASVDIPSPVEAVGKSAFFNCKTLAAVTFASSVKSIGADAFENCPELKEVTVPATVSSVGSRAFALMEDEASAISHDITITCAERSAAYAYALNNGAKIKLKSFGYFMMGDVDGSGTVQAYDARMALRFATELENPSAEQVQFGDINSSGQIDAADARKILRVATGLESF
ncbi:MAG: leucine-rich repeat protein [Clostridiales bacterium]|jgi:hypothetical protein|nr:leucine-rich repeat protein [Clostridiales bacterium]